VHTAANKPRLAVKKHSADQHITNVYSQRIPLSNSGTCKLLKTTQDEALTLYRKEGQGGDAENKVRDLRAELLRAEAAHFAKKSGRTVDDDNEETTLAAPKRTIEDAKVDADEDDSEDPEAKRRRLILEEARDLDADSDGSSEESSDEE